MLLGYCIDIPNINSTMLDGATLDKCSRYLNIYEINKINPLLTIRSRKNLGMTYDNFLIVSQKFKEFCENEKYTGLQFVSLPSSKGFYWLKVHNIVEFDSKAYGTRFINYNEECRGYEEIIGATPACLKNKKVIEEDNIFRSDLFFASHYSKSPLLFVSEITKQKLKNGGFKEIYFEKILDKYDWQK